VDDDLVEIGVGGGGDLPGQVVGGDAGQGVGQALRAGPGLLGGSGTGGGLRFRGFVKSEGAVRESRARHHPLSRYRSLSRTSRRVQGVRVLSGFNE
jgi:hypothetical protein